MSDSVVAVSFTDGVSGKGCGVVLYTINKDGSLDGKVGYWGNNTMETEKATPKSAGSLDGVYDIAGKNPEGKEYKGKLTVIQSGDGYTFDWVAGTSFSGYGIRADDYIAVGFGGKQCSFVGYDVQPDGSLNGKWGSHFARKFGTEIAKRKVRGLRLELQEYHEEVRKPYSCNSQMENCCSLRHIVTYFSYCSSTTAPKPRSKNLRTVTIAAGTAVTWLSDGSLIMYRRIEDGETPRLRMAT